MIPILNGLPGDNALITLPNCREATESGRDTAGRGEYVCVEGEEMPAQAVRPTGTIHNNPTDQHSAKGILKEFMKDNEDTILTTMTSL
jgi:hypothetical protein